MKLRAAPTNGSPSQTDRKENVPMARVHAHITPRFQTGLTDRSLDSMVRARTMIITPTREFSWPNTPENPDTNTHIRTKNSVFPARVLASMDANRGEDIS